MKAVSTLALLIFMVMTGCVPPSNTNQAVNSNANVSSNAKWDAYVAQFLNDYFAANPQFGVYQGKHEFDGKLADWSEAGLTKEIARLKSEREKASAFKDSDLDEHQRFERDYLIAQIDKDLFWRETADQPHTNPYWYSDSIDPDVYVSRPYAPLETRIKAYTEYAKNVPAALQQIKANLKLPLAKNLARIGRQTIGGLAGCDREDVLTVFELLNDGASEKEFKEPNAASANAYREFQS